MREVARLSFRVYSTWEGFVALLMRPVYVSSGAHKSGTDSTGGSKCRYQKTGFRTQVK